MSSIFSKVKGEQVKSSVFNISEEHRLSCNMGTLIPILCKEVLPKDKFKISTELLIKLAPLKAPMMQRLKAKVDYFFVPNFQISNVFEKFINPKINTDNSIVLPYFTPFDVEELGSGHFGVESLADYLGLPITQTNFTGSDAKMSILPFLAYQHIYNSYYRDQNLQPIEGEPDEVSVCQVDLFKDMQGLVVSQVEDNQIDELFKLRSCSWKKDYFTSALPSPQAGDDVYLPVGDKAPLVGSAPLTASNPDYPIPAQAPITMRSAENESGTNVYVEGMFDTIAHEEKTATLYAGLNGADNYADLTQATGISINNFRKLFALQRFKELAERGGTRYTEMVRNFFGAFLPDGYVDRPIYLGGQVQPINVGEVLQTSGTDANSPQGYRAGVGNSYGSTRTVTLHAQAHGFVMGLLRIMPEATYSQGLDRMWTRSNIFDFAFPTFANLGEQEILTKEVFFTGGAEQDVANNSIFGYTPRYAEYKVGHCHTCGQFRPGQSLAYWSMQRVFANKPELNSDFIDMKKGINYSPFYQTTDAVEHCYVDLYNHIYARRPLPYFGTPSKL